MHDETWIESRDLEGGKVLRLRLLRAADRERVRTGFERLSSESRYRRFLTATPHLPDEVLDHLMATDDRDHVAIGAEILEGATDVGVEAGIARFARLEPGGKVAEAAITVVDDFQRRGIGRILLEALIDAARERGVRSFRAYVLAENDGARALLAGVDPEARPRREGDLLVFDFDLPEGRASDTRESPLHAFLRLAASGVEIVLRRLSAGTAPEGDVDRER